MVRVAWLALGVAACGSTDGTDGTDGPAPTDEPPVETGTTTIPTGDGFCAVRTIFVESCAVCHGSIEPQSGLDLQTDPWAAVVGVTSPTYGAVLVAPGDPEGSLLLRKMKGTQSATEGDFMPTTGMLPARAAVVEQWIADGAPQDCGTTGPTTIPRYHPKDWALGGVHGPAYKQQTESDCRDCHGSDLSGGSSEVSCASCHDAEWQTTCTMCHGGVASESGAPPEDIDDDADPATISFVPHSVHESGRIALAFDCVECHAKPTDALTPGHLFDDATPASAEVAIASGGTWTASAGSCSNLYCHGDGRTPGTVAVSAGPRTCHDCHADATTPDRWGDLSGAHERHLGDGYSCSDCHADASGSDAIDDPALHVNGRPDVAPPLMTWNATDRTCEGDCHGTESW